MIKLIKKIFSKKTNTFVEFYKSTGKSNCNDDEFYYPSEPQEITIEIARYVSEYEHRIVNDKVNGIYLFILKNK